MFLSLFVLGKVVVAGMNHLFCIEYLNLIGFKQHGFDATFLNAGSVADRETEWLLNHDLSYLQLYLFVYLCRQTLILKDTFWKKQAQILSEREALIHRLPCQLYGTRLNALCLEGSGSCLLRDSQRRAVEKHTVFLTFGTKI